MRFVPTCSRPQEARNAAWRGATGRVNTIVEKHVRDWALPQFYFHLMTAYAILRAGGVPLGKADYVGYMFQYLRSQPTT